MRKLLTILLITLLAVLPMCSATAQTQKEWNQECRSKTKGTTTLYAKKESSELTVIGSLPGGTYIKLGTYDYDLRMWDIAYWNNGARSSAWVKRENVTSAETMVHFSDGTSVSLPEALVKDVSALQAYIHRQYPGRSLKDNSADSGATDGTQPLEPGSSGKTESSRSSNPSASSAAKSRSNPSAALSGLTATLDGKTVTISQLGVYQSAIIADSEEATVLTADLLFAEDVPVDKAVAVIHAPRTGKCTLRQKASASAKSLGQCKAGTIVPVLEYGSKFCKISYDGEVGYVLTSCLKFYGEADEPIGTGVLIYNGKATGKTTINIRNDADDSAHKIAQWHTGTTVAVFNLQDGWYEIEYDGMHGFVQKKFLTLDE